MKSATAQAQFDGYTVADKTEEAIRFLQDNEPDSGYTLGFSGGKDSIVTYNLAKMAGVKFHQCMMSGSGVSGALFAK